MMYGIVVLTVLVDQTTKLFATQCLALNHSFPILLNVFHLTLVYNRGIAFGLFREYDVVLFGLITLSLILLLFFSRRSDHLPALARMGYSLILGGAVGNWIDRVRLGFVIDFLDFRVWPVFNFSDTAITVGVILYIWSLLSEERVS